MFFPTGMKHPSSKTVTVMTVFLFLLLTACSKLPSISKNQEQNDRDFVTATRCIRTGDYDGAYSHLLSVTRKYDKSPESYLLLGTLCIDQRNDPIAAMYFLKCYSEQSDNASDIRIANNLINTAKKNFLKSLPVHNDNMHSESEMVEIARVLKNQNATLQQQNISHQQEIASYKSQISDLTNKLNVLAKQCQMLRQHTPIKHTVQPGETLSSISTIYYGNPQYWKNIMQANQETLHDSTTLKVGQQLIIP